MNDVVFSKRWFEKNQDLLLWWANTKFGKDQLCIDTDQKITRLDTNAYYIEDGLNTLACFRTHNKYKKRLYYSLRYLWEAMHFFDKTVARVVPELNLGFDTLTAYPDPDPETYSCDGYVGKSYSSGFGVDWTTIIDYPTGNNFSATGSSFSAFYIRNDSVVDGWRQYNRSLAGFRTAGIGAGKKVTSAILSLNTQGKQDVAGDGISPGVCITDASPASNTNIIGNDYACFGGNAYASLFYANLSANGTYTDLELNELGRNYISLTGVTNFGIRNHNYDFSRVAPNWTSHLGISSWNIYGADSGGTSVDPKLVVEYSSAFVPRIIIM